MPALSADAAIKVNLMSGDAYRESLRRYKPKVFVDGREDPDARRDKGQVFQRRQGGQADHAGQSLGGGRSRWRGGDARGGRGGRPPALLPRQAAGRGPVR